MWLFLAIFVVQIIKYIKRADMSVTSATASVKREQDTKDYENSNRGERIIRLPISESEYATLISDKKKFMIRLSPYVESHPELFPNDWFSGGYGLHGYRTSKKLGLTHGIVRSKRDRRVLCDIQPNFVMPYMAGFAKDVAFGLLLLLYGVPLWLVAYGLGRDAMYWQRLFTHIGRFDLLGTTVRDVSKMPKDLSVDEKITFWRGKEVFACMTAGSNCILGMGLSQAENETSLGKAYGKFKEAANRLTFDYQPVSISIDGWFPTKNALKTLFSKTALVLCFLHSVIKIRQVTQKEPQKKALMDKVWKVYQAADAKGFDEAVMNLETWTKDNIKSESIKERVFKIGKRKEEFKVAFTAPTAMRTTNMVDRLMKPLDRFLFMKQYFHGDFASAQLALTAFALCLNFAPFCPRTMSDGRGEGVKGTFESRAQELNLKVYDKHWLLNLLASGSTKGLHFPTDKRFKQE